MSDIAQLRARLEAACAVDAPPAPSSLTVESVAALYLAHAQHRYNGRWGTKEHAVIRNALAPLRAMYGDLHPSQLTSLHLRAVRQYFIDERKNCRSTVQAKMERIVKAWGWLNDLEWFNWTMPTVGKIPYGHVIQREPIKPVAEHVYQATLERVVPIVGIMLKAIRMTAMRPGECCDLHSADIDMTVQPWCYRPALHKGKHLGRDRPIFIGPRLQLMIQPYLRPGYLWWTSRGNRYTPQRLLNAIEGACRQWGIPRWHTNQLRHLRLTELRREEGLDAAQAVAGHARVSTTQVYSERQMHLATEAALKFG